MSDTPPVTDWASIAWDAVKTILAGLNLVVLSAMGVALAKYRGYIAMLLKHDDQHKQHDTERGEHRAFRIEAAKGPIGEKLTASIIELKDEDRRLHRRISLKQRALAALKEDIAVVKSDLRWIRSALGDKTEHDDKQ